ncbi:DinB family protein [Paenibacillus pini]|uniref:DinB-like domain-containing protein n=1 Tax=Paenibacillus pini JCM 16418 TaxID=1236976 RepID=W7YM93_9BACL|nr:DinB family protein [Paenibacillus pini]GAF08718.1 hypothetical protein JCM16418_2808 [Paenibacillus pini JCM 16418]
MRDSYIIGLLGRTRNNIVQKLQDLPESKRNIVPEGFNNSIHWQIGHILTVTNFLVFHFAGKPSVIPDNYPTFFGPGTKPADWTEEPPAWDTLIAELSQQVELIQEHFEGHLSDPVVVKENFAKAETVDELLVMNLGHENSHAGMINSLIKVLA